MFWKRRLKDTGQMKFKRFKRSRIKQEPEPLIIPPEPAVQQVLVAEPEPVSESVEIESMSNNSSQPPRIFQAIFIRLKKDRLLKFLLALLIGILLLLLFLAVFASPASISRSPVTNTGTSIGGTGGGLGYGGYTGSTGTYSGPGVSVGGGGSPYTSIEPYTGPIPTSVVIGDTTCFAKLAITNEEQIRGLRFTAGLAPNECMVYLFNRADYYPFWAKDMNYPMDIIFIGSDRSVNDISEGVPPCTGSCPMYKPEAPAQYVVEVNAGYVSEHFIERGDPVVFVY